MTQYVEGDRVQVVVAEGKTLSGHITKIQDPGPHKTYQTIKVKFDDPMVMGGTGTGWFAPHAVRPDEPES